METKTLWVVRHAKSAWPPGVRDFERPLAERGHRQSRVASEWLASEPAPAQRVLTSPARRAAETANCLRRAFGLSAQDVEDRDDLYLASPAAMLNVARSLPEGVSSAAIVGHNPSITQFVNLAAGRQALDNLPTFGMVRFTAASAWRSVTWESFHLERWTSPKRLEEAR